MNHRFCAQLRRLPECPECAAPPLCACRNAQGGVCAPHRSRERVAAGEIFAISADELRRQRKLRVVLAIQAAIDRRTSSVFLPRRGRTRKAAR